MKLTEKSELNKPQVQLASGNSCGKAEQNYLQSTSSLWWKEYWKSEAVIAAKGSHFDESNVKEFFVLLLFNLYLRKNCIFYYK